MRSNDTRDRRSYQPRDDDRRIDHLDRRSYEKRPPMASHGNGEKHNLSMSDKA
jgi:hypothetical protein